MQGKYCQPLQSSYINSAEIIKLFVLAQLQKSHYQTVRYTRKNKCVLPLT